MQPDVVAGRLHPVDFVRPEEEQTSARLDHQPVGLGLIASQVLDQCQQPTAEVAGLVALDMRPGTLQRLLEALAVERLQQVIKGTDLEGTQSVLVVGGHEDDEGHLLGADRLDDLKPIQAGHLHVEKHEVGRMLLDRANRLFAVAALRDDLNILFCRKQARQTFPRERLVVHDHRT